MLTDSIIKEIHKIREEHAKKFNYNLIEIFNDLKEQEWKKICFFACKKSSTKRI